jgi:hypothetical protein
MEIIQMNANRKTKLAMAVALTALIFVTIVETKASESDLLQVIKDGIKLNENLIENISFDYILDSNISEAWHDKQFEFIKTTISNEDSLKGIELRVPNLEHKLRTGHAIFEGDKFNITSKEIAASDQEIFEDEIVISDGVKLTELKLKEHHGYISGEVDARKGNLMFDPRNFPRLFTEGRSLYSVLTDPNTTAGLVGTEKIEGDMCYVIDIVGNYINSEGIQRSLKKRCWVDPEKGFLIKKAIAYSVKSPDQALSVTQCNLAEVSQGMWYYSKVTFRSYPLFSGQSDVVAILELSNIGINQQLDECTFVADISKVETIYDEVIDTQYSTKIPQPEIE